MDSAALQELIAQVRGETTALAQAQQKVAMFTSELAQHQNGGLTRTKAVNVKLKVAGSGWVPAGGS
jgi:hypothetical protein